jgi:hypothetical protein
MTKPHVSIHPKDPAQTTFLLCRSRDFGNAVGVDVALPSRRWARHRHFASRRTASSVRAARSMAASLRRQSGRPGSWKPESSDGARP